MRSQQADLERNAQIPSNVGDDSDEETKVGHDTLVRAGTEKIEKNDFNKVSYLDANGVAVSQKTPASPKPKRKRRVWMIIGGVTLLLLVLAGAPLLAMLITRNIASDSRSPTT
ncbi:hypothetical protein CC1G_02509 [Coprinopsis cinerea okayama7|uniref:Uncharacterized protein n=1 Tax=Coprinopsis cinerea (strain Okayama-7 / 130 / ATCC MYA-4618 / FGSC 9003) TaxID=240176 RepID=A8NBP9_COPC7|nr:hypothetical protein CC1G_02509 [Coprinopsis cinerea okayama7\|eukprot:XP_001832247.2 hypothetical protein CC1G_02509 [Coprinopsis cinerea okayama7\